MKSTLFSIIDNNLCQEIVMPPYTMRIPKSRHKQPKPKYKFSRQWYEVAVPLSRFDYNLNPVKDDSRLLWCAEQFGPQPDHPDAWSRWYSRGLIIRFRDQQDYMLYLLRWGRD